MADVTRRVIQPRALARWARSYGEMDPRVLTSILREVEQGDMMNWVDLCSFILRTDAHVRAVYMTRIAAVAGADYDIQPRIAGDTASEQAAELCRAMMDRCEESERIFADLMHATGLGYAVLEHDWERVGGGWYSTPVWIHPRECRFEPDWTLAVRTASDGSYVRTQACPGKFIVHMPRPLSDAPNVSGELLAIVWDWLFKRWFRKFEIQGLEKFANPFLYGEVPANSPAEVRDALLANLQQMSADQVAVFEVGSGIKVAEISKSIGDTWQTAIDSLNNEITKGLLGSTLNTDIGAVGSHAAAASQAELTMLPRSHSDAKRLAGTVERDWLTPFLRFNTHLSGGVVLPTPKFSFVLLQDDPANIDQLLVDAGAVTIDEMRVSRGLEPWGAQRGGDEVAKPAMQSAQSSAGGDATPPLSLAVHTQPAPTTVRARSAMRKATLQTSSGLKMTPLETALLGKSGVPARRVSVRRMKQ